jgi:gliding motility-associated-like protein
MLYNLRPIFIYGLLLFSTLASSYSNNRFEKLDSVLKNKEPLFLGPPVISQILQPLANPVISGTVSNAQCFGVADGSINYTIAGSLPPYNYSWSNGTSGKIYGSCWNVIDINNLGIALVNYQVQVNLTYVSGMNPDFSDIRFSDNANTVLYSYWIESVANSANAVFWVKVPNIPSGTTQMRVSYCDPVATSLSNGLTTFEYFEDFNDGNITSWTKECDLVSEPDETCILTTHAETVGYSMQLDGFSHCGGPTKDGVRVDAKKNITLPVGQYKMDISTQILTCLHSSCADSTEVVSSAFYNNAFALQFSWTLKQKGVCNCLLTGWFEERGSAITSTGAPTEVRLRADIMDCGRGYVLQDNFRVRKFSSTPPVITVGPPVTLKLTTLAAGDYTLTVIDGGGSTATKTFTVTEPASPIGVNGARCGPGTVNLSTTSSYVSYKWYDALNSGSLLASMQNYTTNSISSNVNYYVSGVGPNGCESHPRTLVLAEVNPMPSAPIAADSSRCGPGALTLKASGAPASYGWYDLAAGGSLLATTNTYSIPNLLSNTTYYVSAFDSKNCESARTPVKAITDQNSQGTLIGNDTIYMGGTTENIYVINRVGNITGWQKSLSSSFASTTNIANIDTFYKEINLPQTTFYRVSIKSGKCPDTFTNPVEIRVNRPHVSNRDTINSYSDQSLVSGGILSNDVDPDGDALFVLESNNSPTAKGGTISFSSDGSFTYMPSTSFIGIDSVAYTTCDPYDVPVQYCKTSYVYLLIEDNRLANGGIIIYPTLSPNGDHLNDQWVIDGIEKYPENKVTIFDRWGNLVFEEKGYDNTEDKIWSGKSNVGLTLGERELAEGTYFYQVDLGMQGKPKTGFVVIRR